MNTTSTKSPALQTYIAFGLFILLAGGAPVAVRFTYHELAPFWSAFFRFSIAALFFWLMMLIRGIPLPRGRAILGAFTFGTLSVGLAFLFLYFGLVETSGSLASTLVAIVPILTLFFAVLHKLEKLQVRGIAGGILAFIGIAIAVGSSLFSGLESTWIHVLAILAAAACFAEAGIVVKLFPRCDPYATNAIAMTTGAAFLLAASLFQKEPWVIPSSSVVWLSMSYLVIGTVAVFLLYLFILGRWTATRTSYSFVLNPLVAMVAGSMLANEVLTPLFLAGGAVVLVGVYIGVLRTAGDPVDSKKDDSLKRPAVPSCT